MKTKLALLAGIGIGYVLGTRAGRQRFEEIRARANELWHSDQVQSAVVAAQDKVATTAKEQGGKVVDAVKEQAAAALHRGQDSPDPVGKDDYRI